VSVVRARVFQLVLEVLRDLVFHALNDLGAVQVGGLRVHLDLRVIFVLHACFAFVEVAFCLQH